MSNIHTQAPLWRLVTHSVMGPGISVLNNICKVFQSMTRCGNQSSKWPLKSCLHLQLPSDWPIQSLYADRETEAQPDTEQSPEFESLVPAILPF